MAEAPGFISFVADEGAGTLGEAFGCESTDSAHRTPNEEHANEGGRQIGIGNEMEGFDRDWLSIL